MKNSQKGFIVPLLLALIVSVVATTVGGYVYLHNRQQESDMQTPSTSSAVVKKIDQNKVVATATKIAPQPYSISKNNSGNYVMTKNITSDDLAFTITKVDEYDLISGPGGIRIDSDGGSPNLPIYTFSIQLPLDTVLGNVKVDFGTKKYLGKLNLPTLNPIINCIDCKTGPAYSPHPTSGTLPEVSYSSDLRKIGSAKTLTIVVYPITYNNATEDAYVYDGFKITAEYTTKNQVIIDHDHIKPTMPGDIGNTFISNDNIILSVPIINMTSDSVNIKMSSNLYTLDGINKIISSNQSSQVISGNTTGIISTTLKAPNDLGNSKIISDYGVDYEVVGDIYNGSSKIDTIDRNIRVKPSINVEISCFKHPDNVSYHSKIITTNDFVTFEVCVKNPTTQKIKAYIDINIEGQGITEIKRPQGFVDIGPGQTKSFIDKWIPGNYLRTGLYTVQAIVSAGNYQTFQTGQFDYSADDASN